MFANLNFIQLVHLDENSPKCSKPLIASAKVRGKYGLTINLTSPIDSIIAYSSKLTTLKKITPHKLRSTYGTSLYKETEGL